ncbi:MAG: class I SAM-dependent DNA methyltransferase [Lachnospiraceae bacterium]|jgi:SAM-dependent methyltransferase
MYSDVFCKVYNEFGWNYFPEAFSEQLFAWLRKHHVTVKTSLDLACGTGILCEILHAHGIKAAGMDLSEGMIEIAKSKTTEIEYEVANMIRYRPAKTFDLVTCTGDAINHIHDLDDVEQIFRNVCGYLNDGGHFIFDLLNKEYVAQGGPIAIDFNEDIRAELMVTREKSDMTNLKITVYETGKPPFEENIRERLHDPQTICRLLETCGFQVIRCADHLLEGEHGTAWFFAARK